MIRSMVQVMSNDCIQSEPIVKNAQSHFVFGKSSWQINSTLDTMAENAFCFIDEDFGKSIADSALKKYVTILNQ